MIIGGEGPEIIVSAVTRAKLAWTLYGPIREARRVRTGPSLTTCMPASARLRCVRGRWRPCIPRSPG